MDFTWYSQRDRWQINQHMGWIKRGRQHFWCEYTATFNTAHMVWMPCMLWNLIVCLVRQPLKPDDHVLTCWISGPRCSFVGRQWRVIGVLANLPYAPSEGDPQRDMQICRLKLDTEMTWTCLRVLALKNKCVLQGLCPGSRRARQNRLWVL